MPSNKTDKTPLTPAESDLGFDVTCVVGRVNLWEGGEDTPFAAALKLIGRHGADGHYTFPAESGGTVHVTVETSSDLYDEGDR